MIKLKKLVPVLMLCTFALSCEKSITESFSTEENNQAYLEDIQYRDGQQQGTYTQGNQTLSTLRIMFSDHLKYHGTVEAWEYLPGPVQGQFRSMYMSEKAIMDAVGFNDYLDQKVGQGTMSNNFSTSLKQVYSTIKSINDGNVGSLASTLAGQRDGLTLVSYEQYAAQLVYDLLISVANDLASSRDASCKLEDWLEDLLEGAAIGANIAEVITAIFTYDGNPETVSEVVISISGQTIKISYKVLGTVIGGIIGGVAGIFNGDECDCGPPTGISIVNPSGVNCGTTYQLYAYGAGSDADLFNWFVNEGNSSAIFPGQPALLGVPVTQASPAVPLNVAVTALCPEAAGDPIAMEANTLTTTIDLFAIPANQVGDIIVLSNYNLANGLNAHVGNVDVFQVSSTGGAGYNNSYSVSIMPPNLGTVTPGQNGSFNVNWNSAGAGSIRFMGTNNCSGQQNSLSVSVVVAQ